MISKCCKAEINWSTVRCTKCGKHPNHTPPTSTEVEEILQNLRDALDNLDDKNLNVFYDDEDNLYTNATQAITRLIQEAELRGNTNALKAAKSTLSNHSYQKTMEFLTERIASQEAQLNKGREE